MKKILFSLGAILILACNTGSPYSAEPLSSAGEVVSSDMSSVSLPGSSSEFTYSVEVESSSSAEISSSSSSEIWGWDVPCSILWKDRGVEITVEKYAGDSLESVCGRFWVFTGTGISSKSKEYSLLEKRGISIYDNSTYEGLWVTLLKSDSCILKRDLNEDLELFYNAIPVIDTGSLPIEWSPYFIEDSTALEMHVDCWPDIVGIPTCLDIVRKCGLPEEEYVVYWRTGVYIYGIDYPTSISVSDCLSRNRDIQYIGISPQHLPS